MLINNNCLRLKDQGKKVVLKGWVHEIRNFGSKKFIDLRDRWGVTQLVIDKELFAKISRESVIKVQGIVTERKNKNLRIDTGEIEVVVSKIDVLAVAKNQLPISIREINQAHENLRLENRHLDLRRAKMIKNLTIRNQVLDVARQFLRSLDFLEVDTPVLSKPTPEGAEDFLVPYKNKYFALPQSPQLYKQILMAAGIGRYFQIAKVFRNEDLRSDRQLEFNQIDIEISFINKEEIMTLCEELFGRIFKIINVNLPKHFQRLTYQEAIEKYGTDRPDVRFKNHLFDVKMFFVNSQVIFLQKAKRIRAVFFENVINKKRFLAMEEIAKKNKSQGLMYITKTAQLTSGNIWKNCRHEIESIWKNFHLREGTLFIVADEYEIASQALGAVRTEMAKIYNLTSQDDFAVLWIENFPLFEKDSNQALTAMHHPFTAPSLNKQDFFQALQDNPFKIIAKAYDLVINGFEIGGGSIRNHSIEIQKQIFKTIGLSDLDIDNKFGFFLKIFDSGFPPHGGIAFGLERLLMVLTKEESIREVIAFPKNSEGQGLLEKTPSNK